MSGFRPLKGHSAAVLRNRLQGNEDGAERGGGRFLSNPAQTRLGR